MLDVRPIGIEDYAERCSKPLSALHDKLWVETYSTDGLGEFQLSA